MTWPEEDLIIIFDHQTIYLHRHSYVQPPKRTKRHPLYIILFEHDHPNQTDRQKENQVKHKMRKRRGGTPRTTYRGERKGRERGEGGGMNDIFLFTYRSVTHPTTAVFPRGFREEGPFVCLTGPDGSLPKLGLWVTGLSSSSESSSILAVSHPPNQPRQGKKESQGDERKGKERKGKVR